MLGARRLMDTCNPADGWKPQLSGAPSRATQQSLASPATSLKRDWTPGVLHGTPQAIMEHPRNPTAALRGNVCPARPASKSMFWPSIPMLYPETLLLEPRNPKHRWDKFARGPCVPRGTVRWKHILVSKMETNKQKPHRGRFRTARAQRGHSANYYGDNPGNNPENHPPAESCTINSKLKNSNI